MKILGALIACISLSHCFLLAQNQEEIKMPENFGPPLDIPLQLSGSFGELRTNHFHGGLDLRTGGMEGKRVLAAADGYVARISISPYGYGKALYIQHPNGYMTVYAHLQRFSPIIEQYVRQEQFKRESFEVDLYPQPWVLSVKKGELIALSGNTGSSGGPHLHFEIRDQGGERALNPLSFGLQVPDNRHPEITQLFIYEIEDNFLEIKRNVYTVRKVGGGIYKLDRDTLLISPRTGFAVEAFDYQNDSPFRNGVYSIEKFIEDTPVYKFIAEGIRFDQTRYLNAHIDYDLKYSAGKNVHRLFVLPGNQLDAYPILINRGLLKIPPDSVAKVRIVARDIAGNASELTFWAKGTAGDLPAVVRDRTGIFGFNEDILIRDESFVFFAETGTFYRPQKIAFSTVPLMAGGISAVVNFGMESVPFHKFATLKLRVDKNHPNASKFVMVNVVGNKRSVITGTLDGEWFTARIRSFGRYAVEADVSPPKITPVNIPTNGNMQKVPVMRFRISDDLSGIKSYRMEIDGKWVLAEFDGKTGLFFYPFEHAASGKKHEVYVRVTDAVGNTSEYKTSILR
ncbi:peptidase M23 [Thermaurantimonas aggregans]|uniref:Peptidase M23 n=2 Tax=Thermaurantimonas aggregans TaxID=2173829 RepID=A0A401XLC0_9FLAO|nr:M23 family metallopeptidase [Thermaurantimonas aggregans]GCD77817.1 peptidase M23 [Thermaurantimonas aggregans]